MRAMARNVGTYASAAALAADAGGSESPLYDDTVRDYLAALEVDVIIELPGQRWAAFEVRLGAGMVDGGAETLRRFVQRVDTSAVGTPAVVGVIVGTGYAYLHLDGVAVIPIGTLAP